MTPPRLVVLAGPNGAGKTTSAGSLLRDTLAVREFVNADTIAQGLSAFDANAAAFHAGRIMITRLHELAGERADFAFETTLASRSFAPWIAQLGREGFSFELVFLWLPFPEMAMARVAERVRMGGHSVPEDVIRRRYAGGLQNFFRLYRPLSRHWHFIDNSGATPGRPVAQGAGVVENELQDGQL